MSVFDIPGTADWLSRRIDVRAELRIRKELRRLERDADARLVVLWIPGAAEGHIVSYGGDIAALPRPLPSLESTVPTHDDVTFLHGEREHAVVQQVVVGRGITKMAVAIIAPGVTASDVLFDLIAATAERIEEVVVGAIT